jgi:hypothetical protein
MLIGWSMLLITHGILAVLLLGAITHQAIERRLINAITARVSASLSTSLKAGM